MDNPVPIKPDDRLAILLHDGLRDIHGKTGRALIRYGDHQVVAVVDETEAGRTVGEVTSLACRAPVVADVKAALSYDPDVLAIGIAPSGGKLPDEWLDDLEVALDGGLSIIAGLHTRLGDVPRLRRALDQPVGPQACNAEDPAARWRTRCTVGTDEQWICDVRCEPPGLQVGAGRARDTDVERVVVVGTDMAVGKKSTALEIDAAARDNDIESTFVATGQTALMLGHPGIALDAVRIDYAAGAVERAVLDQIADSHGGNAGPDGAELVIVEGQGSLANPASSAVLPLLRGAQPQHLILAHRYGQTHCRPFPEFEIPPLDILVDLSEKLASVGGTFVGSKVRAIALNTSALEERRAREAIAEVESLTGLPCDDPVRHGGAKLLEAIASSGSLSVGRAVGR